MITSQSRPNVRACGLAVLFTLAAHAQINTGTLSGSVSDPSRALISSAIIEIRHEGTGFTRKTAPANGEFSFTLLPIGSYSVTVEAPGFQRLERNGLALAAGQVLHIDLQLELGSVSQAVTVSGEAPLIDRDTSNQLLTVSNVEVRELPQAKLDWSQLANIGTGMRLMPVAGAPSGNSNIAMNGITGEGMSLTLDGTNASTSPVGPSVGFYSQPNVINTVNFDAIQEISIDKGITPASVGGTMAGNVNIISTSGTNRFHGDVYEINSVAAYNARNQFLKTKPGFTFNEFGGSLGGPILRDKLFFFGSYEGVRNNGFQVINTNLPTPYLRSISPAVYDSVFKNLPTVPQPANNPTALNGQYIASAASVNNDLNTTERFDYYLSSDNQLTGRYVHSRPYKLLPSVVATNPLTYNTWNDMVNVNFIHSHAHWTSNTRFGYNRIFYDRIQPGINSDQEGVGISGVFGAPSAEESGQKGYYWTAMEDIQIFHGRHAFQFGGIAQRQNITTQDYNTSSISYSTLADWLANTPTQVTLTYDHPWLPMGLWQFGGYVLDDFRATPTLIFNLGLRYDLYTVPRQKDGLIFNRGVDPARPWLGPGFGDYLPPGSIYNGDHNNFQPRVGFAWTVGSSRKTVIRGGSGILISPTDTFAGALNEVNPSGSIPFRSVFNKAQLIAGNVRYPIPTGTFPQALAAMQNAGVVSIGKLPVNITMDQNNPDPYSIQWMLNVERDMGWGTSLSVGYVGNKALKLMMWRSENLPDRLSGVAPDPTFTSFILSSPIDSAAYNSLQISVKKRWEHRLTFEANYTYAHNNSYCGANLTGRCYPQDNNDIAANWGPTGIDLRQNFNAAYVYELPHPRASGSLGRVSDFLVGGWQISGIIIAQSGLPFTIGNPGSNYPADRADVVAGVNPYLSNYQSTLNYLNPAAFAKVPIISKSGASARPGNQLRNMFYFPGMWNWDAMFGKYFSIREGMRIQFHVDLFNTLNHTNLSGISGSLSAINFGQLTSATSRSMQIGGRLEF